MVEKKPYPREEWEDADRRVLKTQDELFEKGQDVKRTYQELVLDIKKVGLM